MILPTDKDYLETKLIALGKAQMLPEAQIMADWIEKTYHVRVLNIVYDLLTESTPRMQVCLKYTSDVELFNDTTHNFDSEKQLSVANELRNLIQCEILTNDPDIFRKDPHPKYDLNNLYVYFNSFQRVAQWDAQTAVTTEQLTDLQARVNDPNLVGLVMGGAPVFFLHTKAQVAEYIANGTAEKWRNMYYELIAPHDEFGYQKDNPHLITVDSKERFDVDFNGSWGEYWA